MYARETIIDQNVSLQPKTKLYLRLVLFFCKKSNFDQWNADPRRKQKNFLKGNQLIFFPTSVNQRDVQLEKTQFSFVTETSKLVDSQN